MFSKFINDTYIKFCNKADDLRAQVAQQANKAKNEAFKLNQFFTNIYSSLDNKENTSVQDLIRNLEIDSFENLSSKNHDFNDYLRLLESWVTRLEKNSERDFSEKLNDRFFIDVSECINDIGKTESTEFQIVSLKARVKSYRDKLFLNAIDNNSHISCINNKIPEHPIGEVPSYTDDETYEFNDDDASDNHDDISKSVYLLLSCVPQKELYAGYASKIRNSTEIYESFFDSTICDLILSYGVTFKQVFLFSNAMNIFCKMIILSCFVSDNFTKIDNGINDKSFQSHLLRFFDACLLGDQNLHKDLINILLIYLEISNLKKKINNDTDFTQNQLCFTEFFNEIIILLKQDSILEFLLSLSNDLKCRIEHAKNKISSLSLPPCCQIVEEVDDEVVAETSTNHDIRLEASLEIINCFREIQLIAMKISSRTQKIYDYKEERKKLFLESFGALMSQLENDTQSYVSSHESKVDSMTLKTKNDLANCDEEYMNIRNRIEMLENRRQELSNEYLVIKNQLTELRHELCVKLESSSVLKARLYEIGKFHTLPIDSNKSIEHGQLRLRLALQNLNFHQNFKNEIKYNYCDSLLQHLAFEKDRMQYYAEVIDRYIRLLSSAKKEREYLRILLSKKESSFSMDSAKFSEEPHNNLSIDKINCKLTTLQLHESDYLEQFKRTSDLMSIAWSQINSLLDSYTEIYDSDNEATAQGYSLLNGRTIRNTKDELGTIYKQIQNNISANSNILGIDDEFAQTLTMIEYEKENTLRSTVNDENSQDTCDFNGWQYR